MKRVLQRKFRHVINDVMVDSWNRITPPSHPHEPDIIANLVLRGTPGFHRAIATTRGFVGAVNTVGVFCHQSPMVKYTEAGIDKRCELGDVLWCHFHTDRDGKIFRNAILFQSKMSNTIEPAIPFNNIQLKLYREWPQYEYYRSGRLNGQTRNLMPKQSHAGAQYMLIDDRPLNNPLVGIYSPYSNLIFPIATSTVSPKIIGDTPLEFELVRFLFFGSGRTFDSYFNRNTSDEWTKIVWDLLRNGMSRAFNRRRAGFNNSPRISRNFSEMDGMLAFTGNANELSDGIGSDFFSEFQDLFSSDNGGNRKDDKYELKDSEDGGAPSILIFRTTESKG
jgi:hypothetical protein